MSESKIARARALSAGFKMFVPKPDELVKAKASPAVPGTGGSLPSH